jgi:hypothetical protein
MSSRGDDEERRLDGITFGWKVHDSIGDWTAKVDIKASIVLALEAAVVGFVITLSDKSGPLTNLAGSALTLYRVGLALLVISALLAASVVFPQLSRRRSRKVRPHGAIYFGHLRWWNPDQLREKLSTLDQASQLEELANQLVQTSVVAWRKHSLLQLSMVLAVLGGFTLMISHILW